MGKDKKKCQFWKNRNWSPTGIFCGISILISVIALIIAIAGLRGNCICVLEKIYCRTMDFAGIIFAVTGVVVTLFFITFAYDIFKLDRKMTKAQKLENEVREEMTVAHREIQYFIAGIEGIIPEHKKKYIRRYVARYIIGSKYSTDDARERGVTDLQEYNGKSDYDLIKDNIVNNPVIKNNQLIAKAKYAMHVIDPDRYSKDYPENHRQP